MAGKRRCTKAEQEFRCAKFSRLIANGATRQDLLAIAAQEWGLSKRQADEYIRRAHEYLQADWNLDRQAFAAVLLSQLNVIHKKANETNQLNVTLGAINTAARIAKLLD